jgi:hypothetical protein
MTYGLKDMDTRTGPCSGLNLGNQVMKFQAQKYFFNFQDLILL